MAGREREEEGAVVTETPLLVLSPRDATALASLLRSGEIEERRKLDEAWVIAHAYAIKQPLTVAMGEFVLHGALDSLAFGAALRGYRITAEAMARQETLEDLCQRKTRERWGAVA